MARDFVADFRSYADAPNASGFVPIHPTTLRATADEIERLKNALHKAFNQFENITVANTLEVAHDRAHNFIGWAYNNLPGYDRRHAARRGRLSLRER
jgi:hypothetical protein